MPGASSSSSGMTTKDPLTLRWSKRTSHQALNLETAGSNPARSTQDNGPHRLMARILAFQAEGDGSEPSGATARWCNGNTPAS